MNRMDFINEPLPLLPKLASLLPCPALISLTGGGGKTSLMYGLGNFLSALPVSGKAMRVLLATTTKIGVPRDAGIELLLDTPSVDAVRAATGGRRLPLVGGRVIDDKITGVDPAYLDGLMAVGVVDYVVVEADGAKMLPFKAYESYEPVIPSSTAVQVVVVGAEMLREPPGEGNTFRYALLREQWGGCGDAPLSFDLLARMLDSEKEYMKGTVPASKKILLINKCDLLAQDWPERLWEAAEELPARLTRYDYLALASVGEDKLYALAHLRKDNCR